MRGKREYLTAVQIGLMGIGAGLGITVTVLLRYYNYDQLADLVTGAVTGVVVIAIFIPQWMEKFRQWWRLEESDERASEVGRLYQQLEVERAARESAEKEVLEFRQQRGDTALQSIRHLLTDGDEYRTVLERAESAERMVNAMDKQLREQAEKLERDSKLTRHMAAQLGDIANAPAVEMADGLAFPYSTKQLQAMQSAAVKYWATHDRTSPAPYGIQKEIQYYLAELTGENNARKIAELAAAIKPDNLPK